jgi:hypothetical protein
MHCDGSTSSILTSGECTVPKSVFTAAPYNLGQGDSLSAKVIAVNIVGASAASVVGNGGTVL